jgi:peptidyl-prolyl cis-trans isomerase B (cyclophilin B)
MKKALINTAKGAMTAYLYENEASGTVANFIKLSKQGYYNGLAFHRVIPSFVIQGGCPYSKDMSDPRIGTGGPGYSIDCELDGDKQYHDRGVLSMAHSGKNTGGSQFFICHNRQNTKHLDRNHTCFGIVTDGIEIVDAIRTGDVIKSIEIIEED